MATPLGAHILSHFPLSPNYLNINHGSYGSFPLAVRDALREYQRQMDAEPDNFIKYKLTGLINKSRSAIAAVINADVDDVVLVPNATTGVNTILRNLMYEKGDKIVYLGTTYAACEKAVMHLLESAVPEGSLEAIKVEMQYPISHDEILRRFEAAISQKGVRIALFDTVSSIPALRLPFEKMVPLCKKYNVLSLIDGAHGIGCVDLNMKSLDADFFVSNLHKWFYAPRSCAVLHVPVRNQHLIRTSFPTSHGYRPKAQNPPPASSKSAFVELFEFVGTMDYSAFLCVPEAIKFRQEICGGEKNILQYTSTLANEGGKRVASILGTELLGDEQQRNCPMVMVRLPITLSIEDIKAGKEKLICSQLEENLNQKYGTFLPLLYHAGHIYGRLSGQTYLTLDDFDKIGQILFEFSKEPEKPKL